MRNGFGETADGLESYRWNSQPYEIVRSKDYFLYIVMNADNSRFKARIDITESEGRRVAADS